MALQKCPECGHKISEHADSCPRCGIYGTALETAKLSKMVQGCITNLFLLGIVALGGLAILLHEAGVL